MTDTQSCAWLQPVHTLSEVAAAAILLMHRFLYAP